MLINISTKEITPLKEKQLDELNRLGTRIYKGKNRQIFKVIRSNIKFIKWNKPTPEMLKDIEEEQKRKNKVHNINTFDKNYIDRYCQQLYGESTLKKKTIS